MCVCLSQLAPSRSDSFGIMGGKSGSKPTPANQTRTKYRRRWLKGEGAEEQLIKDVSSLLEAHVACKTPGHNVVMRDLLHMIHVGCPRMTVHERNPVTVTRTLFDGEKAAVQKFYERFEADMIKQYGDDYVIERDNYLKDLRTEAKLDAIEQLAELHHAAVTTKLDDISAGKNEVLDAIDDLKTLMENTKNGPGSRPASNSDAFRWANMTAEDRIITLARMQQEISALSAQVRLDGQLAAVKSAADCAEASADAKRLASEEHKRKREEVAIEKQRKLDEKQQKAAQKAIRKAEKDMEKKAAKEAPVAGRKKRSASVVGGDVDGEKKRKLDETQMGVADCQTGDSSDLIQALETDLLVADDVLPAFDSKGPAIEDPGPRAESDGDASFAEHLELKDDNFMLPAPAVPISMKFSLEVLNAMGDELLIPELSTKDKLAGVGIFDILQLRPAAEN